MINTPDTGIDLLAKETQHHLREYRGFDFYFDFVVELINRTGIAAFVA